MMHMQARHLVHKLIPPGWQYEQTCFVCTALFNHAIYEIYEGFYQVVPNFMCVVYIMFWISVGEISVGISVPAGAGTCTEFSGNVTGHVTATCTSI
jgi:hypothetical protein